MTHMQQFHRYLTVACAFALVAPQLRAQQIPLQTLVTPSTVITKDNKPVIFALHAFIEFKSLSEVFPYIDAQKQRWPTLDRPGREALAKDLLRRAVESRVVSMMDERPFETLVTHTEQELRRALANIHEPTPPGYADAFLALQQKCKHSLN